jgi:hypothetical protein
VTYKPPFPGATAVFTNYTYASNCSRGLLLVPPQWSSSTGRAVAEVKALSHFCHPINGSEGSDAGAASALRITVPFLVTTSGSHHVSENWTLRLNSTSVFTASGCPAKNISFDPNQSYESAICQDQNTLEFSIQSQFVDLNNSSWTHHAQSFNAPFFDYTDWNGWQNTTSCGWSPGGPPPGCINSTGRYTTLSTPSGYVSGVSHFTMNGVTHLSVWADLTNMSQRDHFTVITILNLYVDSELGTWNIRGYWNASTRCSIDMGSPGLGAWLKSLSIS